MYSKSKYQRGFTLAEMVVVIGIIGMLSSVVLFSVDKARQNARDKTRMVDIEQMHLTMKLHKEWQNSYPAHASYDGGVEIGVDATLKSALAPLQPSLPIDPKSSDTYKYIYDTDFDCTSSGETVLYVKAFESLTSNANAGTVCTSPTTDATGDEYIILLE